MSRRYAVAGLCSDDNLHEACSKRTSDGPGAEDGQRVAIQALAVERFPGGESQVLGRLREL